MHVLRSRIAMMKQMVLLFVISLASVVTGEFTRGIRVVFGVEWNLGDKYFIAVPMNVSEAKTNNWTETERPDGPLKELIMYCPVERHLCALYDDTENVAGLQIAVEADEFTETVFDWTIQGFTKWTPSTDNVTYWALQQYFVSEDFLAKSQEERLASRNEKKTLQQDGIWVTGFNGELMKVSNNSDELPNSNFTKQACIPWMGYHYIYNTTTLKDMECSSDTLLPWFPLVYSGELIGSIFGIWGQLPVKDGQTNWFERPPRFTVQSSFPGAPECQLSMVTSPGLLSMHIFYVDNPRSITCLFQ